jgi:hypothetical protein
VEELEGVAEDEHEVDGSVDELEDIAEAEAE